MWSRAIKAGGRPGSLANAAANLRASWKLLLAITLVALGIRLVAVRFLYTETWNEFDNHLLFGFEIGRIARSIAMGHGFANPMLVQTGPTAWMTPVYPYLLAGVFKVFGIYTEASAFAILSLNSLFSALICVPVFLAAQRGFGRSTAIVAAWLWALWPYSIYIASSFVWETCLSALLLAILFVWAIRLKGGSPGLGAWFCSGLLWGFTALTNSAALSLFPFLSAWALYPEWKISRRKSVQSAALVALGLLAFVLPWQARNDRVFHRQIPLRDTFWVAFRVGNDGNTQTWADPEAHPTINPQEQAAFVRLGEIDYIAWKRQQSLDFVKSHPAEFAVLCARRFLFFWTGFWDTTPRNLALELHGPGNAFLSTSFALMTLLGLWRALRDFRARALPFLIVLIFYPLVYYLTDPEARYRHMIEPEMMILAALGAQFLLAELFRGFPALNRAGRRSG